MAQYTANLNITTGRGDSLSATKSGIYNEIFNIRQEVNNITGGVTVVAAGTTKAAGTLPDAKSLIIKNTGVVGAEVVLQASTHTDATPDTTGANAFIKYLLGAGDFIYLPNIRQMYGSTTVSSGDAYQLDNARPNDNMYTAVNNVGASDAQLIAEALDATETGVDVDEGSYFFVGDLIRVEDEIMEVTAISSNTLTVIRGTHGSTAATHSDDSPLRFPFFNAYNNFTAATGGYDRSQTNQDGRFLTTNFFGYGRHTDGSNNRESMGIVPGSISGKFYTQGYQEMNMSGITAATHSGLVASTEYVLEITVDGGTKFTGFTFITDSSVLTFGGTNGIIDKLQTEFDKQFYTAGNLFEKKVIVSIVNGDLRFTSGSHLLTSAILIEDTGASNSLIDATARGRFPAAAKIGKPVAAGVHPDTLLDKVTGLEKPNIGQFFYDDGHGNIKGKCTGSISYNSGRLELIGAPPNASFSFSANYGSSQSGGNRFGSDEGNCLEAIKGRSVNAKIDTTIEVIGLR